MHRTTTFLLSISSKFTLALSHLSFIFKQCISYLCYICFASVRLRTWLFAFRHFISGTHLFVQKGSRWNFKRTEFDSSSVCNSGCRSWGRTKFTAFRERDTNRYINRHSKSKKNAVLLAAVTLLFTCCSDKHELYVSTKMDWNYWLSISEN